MLRAVTILIALLVTVVGYTSSVPPELQWTRAIDRDDAPVLWALLPEADIFAGNEKGKTALMAAAKLGDRQLLDTLLERGMSLQKRSSTGGTTLMYAVLGNKVEMVRYLFYLESLEGGASATINAQSTNGWTATMIAAAKGFDKVLSELVDHDADPWLADVYGWSPLMRAIDNSHGNVVRFLLNQESIALDAQNENGSTALHIAVLSNDLETASRLIERGADAMVRDRNNKSPLDIANELGLDKLITVFKKPE